MMIFGVSNCVQDEFMFMQSVTLVMFEINNI